MLVFKMSDFLSSQKEMPQIFSQVRARCVHNVAANSNRETAMYVSFLLQNLEWICCIRLIMGRLVFS